MDCIFCKIANGEIPCLKVYEDEYTLVFMDIAKDVDGHMIAIPKKHIKSILDCDRNTLGQLMSTVKKVANHCVDECGYEGVNLLNASDESAGQSVPHFHIHIIPRRNKDNVDAWPKFDGTKCEIEDIYNKIRMSQTLIDATKCTAIHNMEGKQMQITIAELEAYLLDHYSNSGIEQNLFMKLVEEIGEVAEVLNKKTGRKASGNEDLQAELGKELADVIHYTVAIAALNGLDLNEFIIEKDKAASVKYHHTTNLEQFILHKRSTETTL